MYLNNFDDLSNLNDALMNSSQVRIKDEFRAYNIRARLQQHILVWLIAMQ